MPPESDKWGWKHVSVFGGFDKGSGTKRWKCNHCNLRYNGSYSRVRAHLLGFSGVGVKSCPAIDRSLREAFQILEEERLARRKKRISGSEKPGKRIRTSRPSGTCVSKEDVDDIVARFFYADGLNVNVVNSPYFREMTKAIASYGPRYEPPSIDELSDSFLSKEKGRVEKSVALVKESWTHTGCTILCVGRLESMLGCFNVNIFVSSPRGLVFVKAVYIDDTDGADNLFVGVLADVITEVGPGNVLQIISHLEHANLLFGSLILTKFPHLFWSPCTSHSIHRLMDEIAELDWIKSVVICAKEIEQCIITYQQFSPSMFPENLKGCPDPLALKFAPFFCIVQRIFELKQPLQELVVSEEWKQWKLNAPEDAVNIEAAILGDNLWSSARLLLQLFEPFVRLLVILDIDRLVMGDICNWRVQALETVRSKGIGGVTLNQLEELIENRWDVLFSPLHAAGYILNPRYFGNGQAKDKTVMRGWKATVERYESESANRRLLREQLSSYWRLEGSFGDEDAVDCRDKMDPVVWWENFGFETPHLQTLATKVLSQVSSVTMCQEICQDNCSPYLETANRFGVERVEDLVYVQNNLRINSQRNGMSYSLSGTRNVNSCSLSGVKILDGACVDQPKVTASIQGKL
ncbi:HAT, C-terminal dimerization domain containing protein [Trema orientale]|uniref:HAT, C-terminal dimerization domain containing protein n=1 Tax=Trema orientale TaxID=63057 RepID=A0A2P5DPR3_TREOI|nr:HAT, C-terminal dimerization domain containing protein [Trema orientale]